mgnify:FL=1
MSAKTKIVVLRMKELIYTGIFVGLAILLVVLFLAMFGGKDDEETAVTSSSNYIPGVYTASLSLSGQNLDVEVTVDSDEIRAIRLVNLDEAVTTMYPLMEPTLESLAAQILESQSTEGITYTDSTKYTSYVLLQAVQAALDKAQSAQ